MKRKKMSRIKIKTHTNRIIVTLLLFALMFVPFGQTAFAMGQTAKSACLMEAGTKRVLYEKNAHQRLPMASTTKVMTCILAIEACDIDKTIAINPAASGIEGSSIWLSPNEKIKIDDLLYGLMLSSGNDAAEALAYEIAGSIEEFSALMNRKAKEIGAKNTNFKNPHGLPDSEHYTTAYDLALISAYAMENEKFVDVVSTQYKNISWEAGDWDRSLKNKNKLLWDYDGANGVKTGYTDAAGRCVVTAAKQDNMQLVGVVLNDSDMFGDSMDILDYGFNSYAIKKVIDKGEKYGSIMVDMGVEASVDVYASDGVSYPLKKGEENKITTKIILDDSVTAPVLKGQTLGRIECLIDDKLVATSNLKATNSVEENTLEFNVFKLITDWINSTIYNN
jgi:serine-type D-Ala-D-Ala carboxypeptidase (penicillin-binding protein 5/6)